MYINTYPDISCSRAANDASGASAFFCLGTMSQNAPETDIAPEHVHSEEEMQLEIINFGVLS